MDIKEATLLFDTLSQETRLSVFRMLVEAGSGGLSAGTMSKALQTPHNTMSFHLNHLSNAGIVTSRKEGRSVIYTANYEMVKNLIAFMIKDCCRKPFASVREDKKTGRSIIELTNYYNAPERKIS